MKQADPMPPVVKKPRHIRELGRVDISGLAPLVGAVSERTWAREDALKENDFDCFHHTRHIVFRFIRNNRNPLDHYSSPAWDAWKDRLLPVIEAACACYGFDEPIVPKVMLARLSAGHSIDLHRDGAGSNPRTHKIHVPLITNEQAFFTFEDAAFHLARGVAYEVNNLTRHGGRNGGDNDRVHLIFEVFEGAGFTRRERDVTALDA